MKKFFVLLAVLTICTSVSAYADTRDKDYEHPIDTQESSCKTSAASTEEWVKCTMKATNLWSAEVDKYYSLLYKKLKDDAKTAMYDDQKYWNLYKNNEFKVIDALYNKDFETKDRIILRVSQKRDIVKHRAQALHSYYIQTFPETENANEKIPVNTIYKPDNIIQRGLRYLGI